MNRMIHIGNIGTLEIVPQIGFLIGYVNNKKHGGELNELEIDILCFKFYFYH